LPVHPRPGVPAIRALVRAVKGGHGAQANCHALVLNNERGQPSDAAEAVLRAGKTLDIAEK
jgi:tRNA1(Val) A37 N6-methylase TrmN6